MKKRIFVSDIHMSAGWSLGQGSKTYDWLDRDEALAFQEFLKAQLDDAELNEVILAGDVMDTWIYPHNAPPARYVEIVAADHIRPVIAAINTLAENRKVFYLPGNHDIDIMDPSLESFRKKVFPRVEFVRSYLTDDGILAAHGNDYSMWNAEDPNPARKPPIGYYISRMIATIDSLGKKRYSFGNVATALFYNPGMEGSIYVNAPLTFLKKPTEMKERSIFKTPNGDISLADIRRAYGKLTDDWVKDHGIDGPIRSIEREVVGLQDVAKHLAWRTRIKVVVFGHTHEEENSLLAPPTATPGELPEPYAIYANCGAWCDFNDYDRPRPYSYIVTTTDERAHTHTVTIMHWGGGQGNTNTI